jgi:DinB superfamily
MSERAMHELLYGKGAHANPVACVEDLPLELSGRRVEGFPHSIWQLVSHMNFWMDYEVRRIRGDARKYPDHSGPDWPAGAAPSGEQEWKQAVSMFGELLRRLAVLADVSPEELARDVEAMDPCHSKQASTLRDVLWQTLVHNSYHVGQIAMLRQALAAWPPKGGGDSW